MLKTSSLIAGLGAAALVVACGSDPKSPIDATDGGAGGEAPDDDDSSGGFTSSGGATGGSSTGGKSSSGGRASGGVSSGGGSGGALDGSGGMTHGTGGSSTGGQQGSATLDCTVAFESGFETGFPGEFLNYQNGYLANGLLNGKSSGWTIVDQASGEPVLSGNSSYKGWIEKPADGSHRAYPVLHQEIQTPVVNTFWVYLDVDYAKLGNNDWIHFGTWGNPHPDDPNAWNVHTMAVKQGLLEFAHTDPFAGEYIGPQPREKFPLRKWVRFTIYMEYEGSDGFVQVWQDGVPMLRAALGVTLGRRADTVVSRLHWGMYAAKEVSTGTQYNDDIAVWELDSKLTDLQNEPDCYLGR